MKRWVKLSLYIKNTINPHCLRLYRRTFLWSVKLQTVSSQSPPVVIVSYLRISTWFLLMFHELHQAGRRHASNGKPHKSSDSGFQSQIRFLMYLSFRYSAPTLCAMKKVVFIANVSRGKFSSRAHVISSELKINIKVSHKDHFLSSSNWEGKVLFLVAFHLEENFYLALSFALRENVGNTQSRA